MGQSGTSAPSGGTSSTPSSGTGSGAGMGAGTGSKGSHSGMSADGGAGSEQVKAVQKALQDKGMDPGPVDGIMGPKTMAALKAFQKDQKLTESGHLDDQTREKLGVTR
jgi:peptidoglycan hydrolase-like protein with peptidoglycan-binding domain